MAAFFEQSGVLGRNTLGAFVLGRWAEVGNIDRKTVRGIAVINALEFASVSARLIMANGLVNLAMANSNTNLTKAGKP